MKRKHELLIYSLICALILLLAGAGAALPAANRQEMECGETVLSGKREQDAARGAWRQSAKRPESVFVAAPCPALPPEGENADTEKIGGGGEAEKGGIYRGGRSQVKCLYASASQDNCDKNAPPVRPPVRAGLRETGVSADGRDGGGSKTFYSAAAPVRHFFTHALAAHPKLAFDRANEMSVNYDRDCLTPSELKAILSSLHQRGYALVDAALTYREEGGSAVRRGFSFPAGKKPLILSFDDVNYYVKKMNMGMNDRLDVDESGRLFTYTAHAENPVSYDNEVVTIVENFIAEHPDFSYNGARGLLCLTGFDGILGYRTQSGSPNRAAETVRARRVVDALKRRGWRFACHSYGHYHMSRLSAERFAADTDKWLKEVGAIVGPTDVYVYPYGQWEVKDAEGRDCEKHRLLKQRGFRLFCGVGEKDYYARMGGDTLFMDRKPLDGLSLRKLSSEYAEYFDAASLYDSRRPVPFSN